MTKVSERTAKIYASERKATVDLLKEVMDGKGIDDEAREILERTVHQLEEDAEHFLYILTAENAEA